MTMLRSDRWLPAGGIVFVVLLALYGLAGPNPPKAHASGATLTTFVLHHHSALHWLEVLHGLALIGLTCFVVALAIRLRTAGEGALAGIAQSAGMLTIGIAFVGAAVEASLVYRVATDTGPAATKAVYVVSLVIYTVLCYPAAAMIGATTLACLRGPVLPFWYAPLSGIAAVLVLLGGGAMKHTGFYSPDGAYPKIAFVALLAWVLVTSGLLLRLAPPGRTAPEA
jgi:hypothetical protein